MPNDTDARRAKQEREDRQLAKRYPSLQRPIGPRPAEILPTDDEVTRKSKKRYPSHYPK